MRLNIHFFPLLMLISFSLSLQAQKPYRDFDRRRVFVKTEETIVEAEVYDGAEEKTPSPDKIYYWFDHNMIMSSKGGYTGELLHGVFEVQYRNYQLKEQGKFKFGLKDGAWRQWNQMGALKEYVNYKNGEVHGGYMLYDSVGRLSEKGQYDKAGRKSGTICFYKADGTSEKKRFKNGIEQSRDKVNAVKTSASKKNSEKSTKSLDQQEKLRNSPQNPTKTVPRDDKRKPVSKTVNNNSQKVGASSNNGKE